MKIRRYKQINCNDFSKDLDSVNWTMENEDVNQYGSNFINVFNQILDTHAPIKEVKLTKAKIKQKSKPWINNDILNLIKLKDKLHAKFIKESNGTTKHNIFQEYKAKKNEITQLIRNSK